MRKTRTQAWLEDRTRVRPEPTDFHTGRPLVVVSLDAGHDDTPFVKGDPANVVAGRVDAQARRVA